MHAEEVGEASLRSGANYLSQATHVDGGVSIGLPTANGCKLVSVRATVETPRAVLEATAADGTVTVLALARSVAAPEYLAMAYSISSAASVVQLWRVAERNTTLEASQEEAGSCRQLVWHPYRRLLAIAFPDRLALCENVLAGGRTEQRRYKLCLPERAGPITSCAWGRAGSTLVAACEREVIIFRWAIPGAYWAACSNFRYPIPGRRLCTLIPLQSASALPSDQHLEAGHESDEEAEDIVRSIP